MNKIFLQRVFNATTGKVYTYSGTGTNAEITERFVTAAGNNLLDTMVVQLPQFGAIVVYVNDMSVEVNNNGFEFLTDLIPDPVPAVEETPPAEGI